MDSDGGRNKITLLVRQTNGTLIEHDVEDLGISIAELKTALSELTEIPVERIRLMLNSTILDDDKPLEFYDVEDGSVLRLVQLAGTNAASSRTRNVSGIASANAPTPPNSAASFSNQARQMFLSNPRLAQSLMMANPYMRRAIEENPELRQIMSDPSIMRQSLDAAQNPQLMQEVQRNNDRALSNLESTPGGYAHIRRMYHSIQEPLNQAARESSKMPLDDLNRRRARMLGAAKPDASKVNTSPLPNPWAKSRQRQAASPATGAASSRRPAASLDQVSRNADRLAQLDISAGGDASSQPHMRDPLGFLNMPGQDEEALSSFMSAMAGSGIFRRGSSGSDGSDGNSLRQQQHSTRREQSVSPRATVRSSPEGMQPADLSEADLGRFQELFQDKLEQLEEMGFIDKDKNLKALIASDGDLSLAINIITGEED
ncbi:hypothetical protein GGI25_001832 [Coemansia spiralis]|uniref:Ubiquitin-like protein n=2 Tax=Coemansia TaxID=4863 RepID=A0A9W8KZP0_9FUNG|nr:hypothetical protein BX070DRAFT_150145 [Coemansia spiralis]KAJ1993963.1 hypothetical protein EDC05_001874 [Coemansia umbellata]KAJ2622728.1 hypothetical protein GGI26_002997 [Coemansia sp. RSA 1358]KAJ2679060.1 hypothetical protein GGI25_001832 [Coemansia spiralis]